MPLNVQLPQQSLIILFNFFLLLMNMIAVSGGHCIIFIKKKKSIFCQRELHVFLKYLKTVLTKTEFLSVHLIFLLHRSILRRGHHKSQALQPYRQECVFQGEDNSAAPILCAAKQWNY